MAELGLAVELFEEAEPKQAVVLGVETIEFSEIVRSPVKVESVACGESQAAVVAESRD